MEPTEMIIDLFAGGGGASEGIRQALGRELDVAVEWCPTAVACHQANHPSTTHIMGDVTEVDPEEVCEGRPVGLLWLSPPCTEFSRAKNGKPRDPVVIRLADEAIRWASAVRPRVIMMENVPELIKWGPLDQDNYPIEGLEGEEFEIWVSKLYGLGYDVEWRVLSSDDYGAPTRRKRLFVIARCDGEDIVWPEPTHGPGTGNPYIPAAAVIDWSIPCPSIFERKKPLADATLRRIAIGIRRFIIEADNPYIIQSVGHTMVQTGYGERPGQTPRALDLGKPLGTIVAGGSKHALVAAFLSKHYSGVVGHGLEKTLGTVTTTDHHALTAAVLVSQYGTSTAKDIQEPAPTVTAQGKHTGLVECQLQTATSFIMKYYGTGDGQLVTDPLHTITVKSRFAEVRCLLEKVTGSDRAELEIDGELYYIVDIGMRMLSSKELALAQGFPADYDFSQGVDGSPSTETSRTAIIGNSVCAPVARALVAAQFPQAAKAAA